MKLNGEFNKEQRDTIKAILTRTSDELDLFKQMVRDYPKNPYHKRKVNELQRRLKKWVKIAGEELVEEWEKEKSDSTERT